MPNNPPLPDMGTLLPSSALSLSLAGIFGGGATASAAAADTSEEGQYEDGRGGSRGESGPPADMNNLSSDNSAPLRSRSEDDDLGDQGCSDEVDDDVAGEEEDDDNNNKRKKRKKYHRHTAEQIREMEALFKESPHPDEMQRKQLSKQLGLSPRQVKFWFQNRRTQVKAIQERHENSLLKTEIEKLREENKRLREVMKDASCPNCGFASSCSKEAYDEQHLRVENGRLKAEIERLRASIGKHSYGTTTTSSLNNSSTSSWGNDQDKHKSTWDYCSGFFGLEKSRVMDTVNRAVEEVKKMAASGEPLWVKSLETGREILNYDEYMKQFPPETSTDHHHHHKSPSKRCIEASRETGLVFLDIHRLIHSFMDVNQWKEMFPCMIAKAAIVDAICSGEGPNKDGAIQLMFAELQMLTPVVATREVYFIRYCKQISSNEWAIVDVSVGRLEENNVAHVAKCQKRPSGCIIRDQVDGHCKVTLVEHVECQRSTVHPMYRALVNSGLAFGAKHWMATLQQQVERLVFSMATNIPMKDSSGVATFAGRKSMLKLAQRMMGSFYLALGASSYNTWTKVPSKTGDDIRMASRKNQNDPGEPQGVILCVVSSVWLPVSPRVLFDFLRDETRRNEWDVMLNGGPAESIASLAKGQDRGNAVTLHSMQSQCNPMWILQDSSTNAYESMVVYSPVDINNMQSVITGRDSSNVAVLPSGFSILPDGLEERPLVITSRPEERPGEGGSLLTIAFQVLASNTPTCEPTVESIDSIKTLISRTVQKLKASMKCEDA